MKIPRVVEKTTENKTTQKLGQESSNNRLKTLQISLTIFLLHPVMAL